MVTSVNDASIPVSMPLSSPATRVPRSVGVFGGSFDPIHYGHLRMALEAKRSLGLDDMRLMPCYQSPHKGSPGASALQRLRMLSIAVEHTHELTVDARELQREGPSYTADTLASLRLELGEATSIVLLMGVDAYQQLDCWHQWESLRHLAHIAIVTRPGFSWPEQGVLSQWLANADTPDIVQLQPFGGLVVLAQGLLTISATAIREELANDQLPHYLLPEPVLDYIQTEHLYR